MTDEPTPETTEPETPDIANPDSVVGEVTDVPNVVAYLVHAEGEPPVVTTNDGT